MSLAYEAMMFAREVHKDQKRKYTGAPYADHLAEVAGIVATVSVDFEMAASREQMIATAFLHDCVEDQDVSYSELCNRFGECVAGGVWTLSDLEEGNRATRKRLSRERLSKAPIWVQTIKCADLISNTSSIREFGGNFAPIYLEEKRLLLEVMTKADRRLWELAYNLANQDV